jgi:hypothetical protein
VKRTFRFPSVKSAWKVLKVSEKRGVHSLPETLHIEYVVTSFASRNDIAVWDRQRHGVDVVNIVGSPRLASVAMPSCFQFDRDLGAGHCANELTSRLWIWDHIAERKMPLCKSLRENILELDAVSQTIGRLAREVTIARTPWDSNAPSIFSWTVRATSPKESSSRL